MAIKVGDKARFTAYEALQEGQDEILIAGEEVMVVAYDEENGSFTVTAVDDDSRSDALFPEEMEEIVEEAKPARRTRAAAKPEAEAAPAAKPAPKAAAKAAKPAAAPKAETKAAAKPAAKAAAKAEKPQAEKPAAEKAAAPAPAKTFIAIESIEDMVGSHETALASAKEYAEQLAEIRDREEETLFNLGGLLSYINSEKAYQQLGYQDFASYAEQEVGLKKRSAEYYIKVYTDLTGAGVTLKDIEGIGWTKLRALTGAIDKSNKKELLKKAKTTKRDDLVEYMKEYKANTGKASPTTAAPEFIKFQAFKLFKDQGQSLESIIEQAKKTYEVDIMAEAIFYMAMDWMQSQDGDVSLEDALATLNARYGTSYGEEEEQVEAAEEQAATA